MTKEELKDFIKNYNIGYDLDNAYIDIYNACIDYMNDSKDWNLEYLFEDYVTYDTAEEIAKQEIEKGGLIRLYYFLGDANLNNSLFRIDGYGNLTDVYQDDLEYLKEEILERLED